MNKKILTTVILCAIAILLNAQNSELLFSPRGIAEVRITLANGKQIGDIKNEKYDKDYAGKLDGTMIIRNSARSTYDESAFYSGKIQIEGRGNTTWGVPKRPYNIDLLDEAGDENPKPLLDMPESDEWALLAFWHDRSLMRIPLAMYLGRQMTGIPWTPHLQYVELWVNDEYRGLYCLSDKVQRGDTRVDLKKLTDSAEDQTEPRISGGYLLEGSSEEKLNEQEKAVQFRTSRDINFTFKYPKAKNVTAAQREWIKNWLNEFEGVLWGNNFKDPSEGYQKYIETQSFIDWTILHEQSKGPDNLFHASTFVSKERNKKLNMNAPWDFDLSYANGSDRSEAGNMVRTHRWFARLADDPAYFAQYQARFDELRPLFNKIPQILEANYQFLAADGALEREKAKWPQILQEYSGESSQTRPLNYHAHVRYLSDWIQSRDAWCYVILGQSDQGKADRLKQTKPVIRIMDPEAMDELKPFYVKVMQSEKDANSYRYIWNDASTTSSNYLKRIDATGKYWVKIVDSQGNTSLASDTLYFGVSPDTGIDVVNNSFSLTYNNPAGDFLNLNINSAREFPAKIRIIDIGGRVLIDKTAPVKIGNNFIKISTASLKTGVYILHLSSENGLISRKIIVERH
ncbi:MAG: CotH kinase family protein [Dysgonamonadaceae bacterium]|jgi:hypothetical protein|nr:CotH kinase family protein [Dysgonamonadaceae bacterium]